jgi:hypothetical protein
MLTLTIVPRAQLPKLEGEIRYKLVSIEKSATGRMAKFDQSLDGKIAKEIETQSPNGKVRSKIDFTVTGGGVLLLNADKGLVKSNELSVTFSGRGKMVSEANEIIMPDKILTGALRVTVTGSN